MKKLIFLMLLIVSFSLVLSSTATDLGKRGYDTSYGYGLVNALAAVNAS